MNEFFPADCCKAIRTNKAVHSAKGNKGVEQKGQSPSPVKCKAKQSEDLEDNNEGDNVTEAKQSADEIESQSQEADEAKPTVVNSSTDGGENVCKEKESSQDAKATQEHNPMPHAVCEQDQADGHQDESTEVEMNTQTDSQVSYMEAEETLITQEETIQEEKPQAPEVDRTNQENKGEEKGAGEEKGKHTAEPVQPEGPCDTENISSNDIEMNSQVEDIDEPTESQTDN
ncbi:ADP-ribose glycohydrolase MACROD2-like isoform X2 [Lacerta agilis]|uniref:ADP-ribose glycohydrolase MACROD2-like isoform X2 n=1 Tax=Lacerta agilis TaxID=80427 RepID=UPI0014199301|nr:ADP-ribose glycohydrolase MACROD2-like isoform X2 [Lacerta agilis]